MFPAGAMVEIEARSFALNATGFNDFFQERAHKSTLYSVAEAVAASEAMTPTGVVAADAVRSALSGQRERRADGGGADGGADGGGGQSLAESFEAMLGAMEASAKAWRGGPDGVGELMVELPPMTRRAPAKVEL